jgi:ketosteroid isomerase-like protein
MRAVVLALTLLALAACRSDPARASNEVRAVLQAQVSAWNRGEVKGFMEAGYWRSPELTFYSGGSVTKGYDATLARYLARYKSEGAEMGELEFTAIETVPLAGDSVLARGHWKLTFHAKPPLGGLFSLLLRRLPEGWRIVHDHTSVETP